MKILFENDYVVFEYRKDCNATIILDTSDKKVFYYSITSICDDGREFILSGELSSMTEIRKMNLIADETFKMLGKMKHD
jgi:hypothetical protein